jgi:hypothetical protein
MHDLHAKLPLEIREMIYEYLVESHLPRVLPKTEDYNHATCVHIASTTSQTSCVDPFHDEYIFDESIMGKDTSNETQTHLLRTTPLYLRGRHLASDIPSLFDISTSSCKHLRDHVRYLRVYLRCENFERDVSSLMTESDPVWLGDEVKRNNSELQIYDEYRSHLENLCNLPFQSHRIQLELCIFHNLDEHTTITSESARRKYNILETIKPTYFFVKDSGADIVVRYENYSTGLGTDVTWELDLDAETWGKVRVCQSSNRETWK